MLHAIDQRRLDLEPAVRQLGVGRHHLVERRLARPEGIAEQMRHVVVDAEALAIGGDGVHAHVLGDAHRHQVARLFKAPAHRVVAAAAAAAEVAEALLAQPRSLVDAERAIQDLGGRGHRGRQ